MTPIPEWATRAAEEQAKYRKHELGCPAGRTRGLVCNCPRSEHVETLAGTLARVLGPEREALEAEVRTLRSDVGALTEARYAASEAAKVATERAEAAEAACRVAEGLLKHVTRERDQAKEAFTKAMRLAGRRGDDLVAAHDALRQIADATKGTQRRTIAALRSKLRNIARIARRALGEEE